MKAKEEAIRAHAYELWEKEGYPEGRHEEHWHQAEKKLRTTSTENDDHMKPKKSAMETAAQGMVGKKMREEKSSSAKTSKAYKK